MRRLGSTLAAVNLRAGPGTEHPVLTALPPKTPLEVIEQHGYWLHANAVGRSGFVHSRFVLLEEQGVADGFLRPAAEAPAPAAETAPAPAPAQPESALSGEAAPAAVVHLTEVPLAPSMESRITVGPRATGLEKMTAATWNRFGGLLTVLSDELRIDPAVAVAVFTVESGGRGFGPDGRLLIRFENQIFYDRWGRSSPEKYAQHFAFHPEKRWTEHQWRLAPEEAWRPFHGDQAAEWQVLEFARRLNDTAALLSISMGGPQIMGFNYAALGFEAVQQMFAAFSHGERDQVIGFFDFVQGPGATSRRVLALQAQDFEAFASMYNGPGQAGKYGSLIRSVYDLFHQLRPRSPGGLNA